MSKALAWVAFILICIVLLWACMYAGAVYP